MKSNLSFHIIFKYRNVISAWSSGTGAAGVAGALTYALLKYMKVSPEKTLLMMLFVPLIQFLTFFIVLREPHGLWTTLTTPSSSTSLIDHTNTNTIQPEATDGHAPLTFAQKIDYLPNLMKYVLPLFSVYVCEYFINQGLVSEILKKSFVLIIQKECLIYDRLYYIDNKNRYTFVMAFTMAIVQTLIMNVYLFLKLILTYKLSCLIRSWTWYTLTISRSGWIDPANIAGFKLCTK